MNIKVITLFPKFFEDYFTDFGILARAVSQKTIKFKTYDLRSFGIGPRKVVDDRPAGGGVGMVLRPDVLLKAIKKAIGKLSSNQVIKYSSTKQKTTKACRVIMLTPQGKPFTQKDSLRLSKYDELIFVCGRYEGFDERARKFVDEEISIGDYVLMGGELPALVVAEAVIRHIPGVLGKLESKDAESFSEKLLEYPQYTKPNELQVPGPNSQVKSLKIPQVLLSGDHGKVAVWRKEEAEKRTKKRRPDLLK